MIVDMHSHYVPRSYFDLADRDPAAALARLARNESGELRLFPLNSTLPMGISQIGPEMYDPEAKLRAMDRLGVDVAVLTPSTFMFFYSAEPETALRFARLQNDEVAALCQTYPDRLVGLASVPLQDPTLAIAELERCIHELGLKGAVIGTSINGRDLDDPSFLPFFERRPCAGRLPISKKSSQIVSTYRDARDDRNPP